MKFPRRIGPTPTRTSQEAFTLVEVIVAVVVGTIVIVSARSVLGALLDYQELISSAAREQDRAANADRLLRALVGQADLGARGSTKFSGDESDMRFATWCQTPQGWQQRCNVRLAITLSTSEGHRPGVAAEFPDGEVIQLLEGLSELRFEYLASASRGGQWVSRWESEIATPIAMGIISAADTIIVRIGERG